MCLSIPAKIISLNGFEAQVTVGGALRNANLQLIENPKIGDYVLLHAGFALQVISNDEANEIIEILTEIERLNNLDNDSNIES
ncbi:MAG: HypC/HybG/HupF family hydrogenase formation chaperone [Bacteroidales bacterium]|jgi:hydrogenase expression/formation protein HypC|nr:HypC/HybG/HupF family hydrogenase formation chaperone [Bacteroidales bacterium]